MSERTEYIIKFLKWIFETFSTPLAISIVGFFVTRKIAKEQNILVEDTRKQQLLSNALKDIKEFVSSQDLNNPENSVNSIFAKALVQHTIRNLDYKYNQILIYSLAQLEISKTKNKMKPDFSKLLTDLNLEKCDLKSAYFYQTDLTFSWFKEASLQSSNFIKANLTTVSFSKADLQNACFIEANLLGANFEKADIKKANFKQCKNIEPEQIQQAKNWKLAEYDPEFREKLGLPPEKKT